MTHDTTTRTRRARPAAGQLPRLLPADAETEPASLAAHLVRYGPRQLCAEILPELITLDDWGFPIIRDVDIPDSLTGEAREAVRLCPKLALRLDSLVKQRARS